MCSSLPLVLNGSVFWLVPWHDGISYSSFSVRRHVSPRGGGLLPDDFQRFEELLASSDWMLLERLAESNHRDFLISGQMPGADTTRTQTNPSRSAHACAIGIYLTLLREYIVRRMVHIMRKIPDPKRRDNAILRRMLTFSLHNIGIGIIMMMKSVLKELSRCQKRGQQAIIRRELWRRLTAYSRAQQHRNFGAGWCSTLPPGVKFHGRK